MRSITALPNQCILTAPVLSVSAHRVLCTPFRSQTNPRGPNLYCQSKTSQTNTLLPISAEPDRTLAVRPRQSPTAHRLRPLPVRSLLTTTALRLRDVTLRSVPNRSHRLLPIRAGPLPSFPDYPLLPLHYSPRRSRPCLYCQTMPEPSRPTNPSGPLLPFQSSRGRTIPRLSNAALPLRSETIRATGFQCCRAVTYQAVPMRSSPDLHLPHRYDPPLTIPDHNCQTYTVLFGPIPSCPRLYCRARPLRCKP